MTRRAALTALCFLALAVTTASVAGRVTQPHVTRLLVASAVLATLAGGAGLLRRHAWPLAVFLLLIGAWVLARLQVGAPPAAGAGAHLGFYAHSVSIGAATYVRETFPLNAATSELRLLLSLVVFGVTGVAAFLGLSLRRPLPAIALLLCLAGFAFTTDGLARTPLPAIGFVVLSGAFLALSRPLPREHVRVGDALAGGVTAVVAAVIALSILGVTTVEAARPLRDWRTWDLAEPQSMVMGFDWMQNYPRLLAADDTTTVMEVHSPVALYWRANVLDQFSGSQWHSTLLTVPLTSVEQPPGRGYSYAEPPLEHDPNGRAITEQFSVRSTYTDHLFAGGVPISVTAPLALDLSASTAGAIAVDPARGPRTSYSVTAFVPALDPADLVGRGRVYPRDIAHTYLQLPFPAASTQIGPGADKRWQSAADTLGQSQWDALYQLNQRVAGGQTDPYLIALAIQRYLRSGFRYTLYPPAAPTWPSPYAAFLFATHAGYCQHFAGAMAVLLRFNGIPARVAVGFTQGREIRNGVFEVRRTDAHAWVEAYFPGMGWVPFDPTPGFSVPSTVDVASTPSLAGASPTPGDSATPSSAATKIGRPNGVPGGTGGGSGGQAAATGHGLSGWAWPVVLVALLAVWPVGRALLRRRGLLEGSLDARVRAATRLVYATLADYRVDVPASQTLDETAGMLREQFGVDAGDLPERLQAVAFGGRAATAADVADLRALRRRLRTALRRRFGWPRAVTALYGLGATASDAAASGATASGAVTPPAHAGQSPHLA